MGITQLLQDPMAKIYQRMTSYKLITKVILILFHLKFQNTGSISIPVRSLLQGRQTSNQGFVKGEELFPFCDLTFSYSFIYRQRTNQLTVIASDWLSNISV